MWLLLLHEDWMVQQILLSLYWAWSAELIAELFSNRKNQNLLEADMCLMWLKAQRTGLIKTVPGVLIHWEVFCTCIICLESSNMSVSSSLSGLVELKVMLKQQKGLSRVSVCYVVHIRPRIDSPLSPTPAPSLWVSWARPMEPQPVISPHQTQLCTLWAKTKELRMAVQLKMIQSLWRRCGGVFVLNTDWLLHVPVYCLSISPCHLQGSMA